MTNGESGPTSADRLPARRHGVAFFISSPAIASAVGGHPVVSEAGWRVSATALPAAVGGAALVLQTVLAPRTMGLAGGPALR